MENAIIHGLEPKIETEMLRITLKMCDGMLFGSVLDDGVGMSEEQIQEIYEMSENKDYRNHIGVRNVLLRLKNYYNGQAVLKIWSSVNKGTEVKFTIPLDLLTAKME